MRKPCGNFKREGASGKSERVAAWWLPSVQISPLDGIAMNHDHFGTADVVGGQRDLSCICSRDHSIRDRVTVK